MTSTYGPLYGTAQEFCARMQLARNTHNAILTTQHTQAAHINTQYTVEQRNTFSVQSARIIKCTQYKVRAIQKCAQYIKCTQYKARTIHTLSARYTQSTRAMYKKTKVARNIENKKNKSRAHNIQKRSCVRTQYKKTQCVRSTAHRTRTTLHCAQACTLYLLPHPTHGAAPHAAPHATHHHTAAPPRAAAPTALSATHALHPGRCTNGPHRLRAKGPSGGLAEATRVEGSRRRLRTETTRGVKKLRFVW